MFSSEMHVCLICVYLQIWVYGDSFKSMLVAVVAPHEGNTKKWADKNGHKGSITELCSLQDLNQYVLLELKSAAERNKVSKIQIFSVF